MNSEGTLDSLHYIP